VGQGRADLGLRSRNRIIFHKHEIRERKGDWKGNDEKQERKDKDL
jgi:hypothetical protein